MSIRLRELSSHPRFHTSMSFHSVIAEHLPRVVLPSPPSPSLFSVITLPAIGRLHCTLADQVSQSANRGIHDSIVDSKRRFLPPRDVYYANFNTSPQDANDSSFLTTVRCQPRLTTERNGESSVRCAKFDLRIVLQVALPSGFSGILLQRSETVYAVLSVG